jgi:alcohol dehydrogenase (cytochrome c)
MLDAPPASDWLMYRRTYDSWGYSPLDQVHRDNVGELELVWSRAMTSGRQYVTPLAYRGVLYVENPRDIVQALDARTGDLLWEWRGVSLATRVGRASLTRIVSMSGPGESAVMTGRPTRFFSGSGCANRRAEPR